MIAQVGALSLLLALLNPPAPATPISLPTPPPVLTTQLITIAVGKDGIATGARFEKKSGSWHRVGKSFRARVSGKALVPIAKRVRNTGTTPAGTFPLGISFGFESKPETLLTYRKATENSWWVADPASELDDSWQECAKNCSWNMGQGERLRDHRDSYALAISIKTEPSTNARLPKKAAAIFLHLETGRPLSGCVAISRADMMTVLKWLDPQQAPSIAIVGGQ